MSNLGVSKSLTRSGTHPKPRPKSGFIPDAIANGVPFSFLYFIPKQHYCKPHVPVNSNFFFLFKIIFWFVSIPSVYLAFFRSISVIFLAPAPSNRIYPFQLRQTQIWRPHWGRHHRHTQASEHIRYRPLQVLLVPACNVFPGVGVRPARLSRCVELRTSLNAALAARSTLALVSDIARPLRSRL